MPEQLDEETKYLLYQQEERIRLLEEQLKKTKEDLEETKSDVNCLWMELCWLSLFSIFE